MDNWEELVSEGEATEWERVVGSPLSIWFYSI